MRRLTTGLLAIAAVAAGVGAQAQTFSITAIPAPTGTSSTVPKDVNDLGQVVGGASALNYSPAVLYDVKTNTVIALPALDPTVVYGGTALAINHSGQIVGWANTASGYRGALWDAGTHTAHQIDLIPDSTGATARSQGWTIQVGQAINAGGDILCLGNLGSCVWRMRPDPTTGLPKLAIVPAPNYAGYGHAKNLNDHGVVLTYEFNSVVGTTLPCLWDSNTGAFTWIPPTFGFGGNYDGTKGVNNYGVAVGRTNTITATIYDPVSGNVSTLGDLGGGAAAPNSINDLAQVVGYSYLAPSSTATAAFLWQNGVMKNLNSLVSNPTGWNLTNATGMSNRSNGAGTAGYIIGFGAYTSTVKNKKVTTTASYVLIPK